MFFYLHLFSVLFLSLFSLCSFLMHSLFPHPRVSLLCTAVFIFLCAWFSHVDHLSFSVSVVYLFVFVSLAASFLWAVGGPDVSVSLVFFLYYFCFYCFLFYIYISLGCIFLVCVPSSSLCRISCCSFALCRFCLWCLFNFILFYVLFGRHFPLRPFLLCCFPALLSLRCVRF